MKKLFILPIILGLCACDRPETGMLVRCNDKDAVINLYDDYIIVHSDGAYDKIYATGKKRTPSGVELWRYGVAQKWDFVIEDKKVHFINKDEENCYPMVSYVQTPQQVELLCGGAMDDFRVLVGGNKIILSTQELEKTLLLDESQSDSSRRLFVSEDGWVMRAKVEQIGDGDTVNYFDFSLSVPGRQGFYGCLLTIPLK